MMADRVSGLYVRDIHGDPRPILPWKRACWDEDGNPGPCDRARGSEEPGEHCHHHDQWVRIYETGGFLAWVEPSDRVRGKFLAYAWDPDHEYHMDLCSLAGDEFARPLLAMKAADQALLRAIKRYREQHTE